MQPTRSRCRASVPGLAIETKPDLTPVTEADRAVESELRRILAEERPDDAILGEEEGAAGGGARRWIVDPIDGTRNYSRGIPVWATLIALEADGVVQLGVVSAPALARRWWAERGAGAFANGETNPRLRDLDRSRSSVLSFAIENEVPAIARRAWHARGFGDFWSYMLIAEGSVDGAVDAAGRQASGISLRCRSSSRRQAVASPTSAASRGSTAEVPSLRTASFTTSCSPLSPVQV